MDKLLAALLIVLLFFIPILMKKTIETEEPEVVATEEPCTIYIKVEGVDKPLPLE